MATRRSENQKASNLRKRVRDGGKLKPEESDWLKEYESTKRKPGRPQGSTSKEPDEELPDAVNYSAEPDLPEPEPEPVPNNWEPPEDLPAPPRIVVNAGESKRGSSDWREKYRNAEQGGTGREKTCVLLASHWLNALKLMEDSLRSAGIEPIIDAKSLGPSIVLTVDELLPDHVEFSPRVVAVGGSTMLGVQRFMRRDEIAKVQKREKERKDHEEWKRHRKDESPSPVDISSHPDYKPADQAPAKSAEAPTQAQAPIVATPSEPPITLPARQAIAAAGKKDPVDPDLVI